MSRSVHLTTLLAKVRDRPNFALAVPCGGGRVILRCPQGQGFVALRLNAHGAICWHRGVADHIARTYVREAVEAGHSVTVDDVELDVSRDAE